MRVRVVLSDAQACGNSQHRLPPCAHLQGLRHREAHNRVEDVLRSHHLVERASATLEAGIQRLCESHRAVSDQLGLRSLCAPSVPPPVDTAHVPAKPGAALAGTGGPAWCAGSDTRPERACLAKGPGGSTDDERLCGPKRTQSRSPGHALFVAIINGVY